MEDIDARQVRFEHEDLKVITRTAAAHRLLDICTVERNCAGVLFIDGEYVDTAAPGLYAFWKDAAEAKLLSDNPTLMRLRELEVLEKIASAGNLNVVLGEKGLAERVVNLL